MSCPVIHRSAHKALLTVSSVSTWQKILQGGQQLGTGCWSVQGSTWGNRKVEDPMFCGVFRHDVIYDVMTSLTAIYRQTCQKSAHARTVKNHAHCLVFSLSFPFSQSVSLSDAHCSLDPLFLCLCLSDAHCLLDPLFLCLCLSDAHCLLDPLFLCLSVSLKRSLPPRPSGLSLCVCVSQTLTVPPTL